MIEILFLWPSQNIWTLYTYVINLVSKLKPANNPCIVHCIKLPHFLSSCHTFLLRFKHKFEMMSCLQLRASKNRGHKSSQCLLSKLNKIKISLFFLEKLDQKTMVRASCFDSYLWSRFEYKKVVRHSAKKFINSLKLSSLFSFLNKVRNFLWNFLQTISHKTHLEGQYQQK